MISAKMPFFPIGRAPLLKELCAALALLFVLMFSQAAFAVPANPNKVFTVQQPDGSSFQITTRGDERSHWSRSVADGYIVVYDAASKWWDFAVVKNGALVSSEVHYHINTAAPAGAVKEYTPLAGSSLRTSVKKPAGKSATEAAPARWTPRATPLAGDRRALVVRVTFEDTRGNTTIPSVDIKDHSRDVWGDTLSVTRYYKDQSKGRLKLTPISGISEIIKIEMTSADYNEGRHPDYKIASTNNNEENIAAQRNEVKFVQNVLEKVQKNNPELNFASFDANHDKKLTADELVVYLILAGYEKSGVPADRTPSVWAHQASSEYGNEATSADAVQLSGDVTLSLWAMNGEIVTQTVEGVTTPYRMPLTGTMCHELGHQLCALPDLYDTSYYNSGLGIFSLMAIGCDGARAGEYSGTRPVNLDAWSRYYLGWETPSAAPKSTVAKTLSIGRQSYTKASSPVMVDGPASTPYQYYLMEVRDPTSADETNWDAGLQAWDCGKKGVLLIHADETIGKGSLDLGNDINQHSKSEDDKDTVYNPHQGIMAIWPYADPRVKGAGSGTTQSLWYAGNDLAKANGLFPDSAVEFLKSNFFAAASSKTAELRTGIKLFDFSAPADEMTCTYALEEQNQGGGGNSGGGCSAGVGTLALLAAAPLFAAKRKRARRTK
ncbi:MAG: Synerg-CTERM sorting domain-containing protein [Cloacibacillus sp.]